VEKIDNIRKANQLARAIASDISIYNSSKIEQALKDDNFFTALKDELEEGRSTFEGRVSAEIYQNTNIFEKALVDILLASRAHIKTPIW
jgi:hypothetical protein